MLIVNFAPTKQTKFRTLLWLSQSFINNVHHYLTPNANLGLVIQHQTLLITIQRKRHVVERTTYHDIPLLSVFLRTSTKRYKMLQFETIFLMLDLVGDPKSG